MSVGSHRRFLSILGHRFFKPPRLRPAHDNPSCVRLWRVCGCGGKGHRSLCKLSSWCGGPLKVGAPCSHSGAGGLSSGPLRVRHDSLSPFSPPPLPGQPMTFPPEALWVTVGLSICLVALLVALAFVCWRKIKQSCEEENAGK